MRKILEALRLRHDGRRSHRKIARAVIASPTTVGGILRRAKLAGIAYLLPVEMSEPAVETVLYPPQAPSSNKRPEPDWSAVHRELRRNGEALDLLWQEYKAESPDGATTTATCEMRFLPHVHCQRVFSQSWHISCNFAANFVLNHNTQSLRIG